MTIYDLLILMTLVVWFVGLAAFLFSLTARNEMEPGGLPDSIAQTDNELAS